METVDHLGHVLSVVDVSHDGVEHLRNMDFSSYGNGTLSILCPTGLDGSFQVWMFHRRDMTLQTYTHFIWATLSLCLQYKSLIYCMGLYKMCIHL